MKRIPVLLFHRVDEGTNIQKKRRNIEPGVFNKQMSWMSEQGYRTISLEDMHAYYTYGKSIPEKSFCITFDDGYYDNYSQAFHILKKYGFKATIFLATDLIRETSSASDVSHEFLSWVDIREMVQEGFYFESHGCSHRSLIELSIEEIEREALESKKIIENKLQVGVQYFCYPFGKYNELVKRTIKMLGYKGAFGGIPFDNNGPLDCYEIGRVEIYGTDSLNEFRFKILHGFGYLSFIKRRFANISGLLHFSRQ